jgi:LAO/AO transport system kinase
MSADELAERLLSRDRAAVSEALNLIDDSRPEPRKKALALLDALERGTGDRGARRVGITGAPGVGKSTLLDAVVRALRGREQTLGIIAVDPSSQRTGGALLGDRLRVRSGAADPGVFLRSMAARERLGGLADATHAGVAILSAVFDYVFVETVGVGQSESEVATLVDTLVLVAQPASGDLLQFMKAGIIELPDLFVVNKADLGPAAERTAGELRAGLGLGEARKDGWRAPVLLVSAREGRGIEELLEAVEAHRVHLEITGRLAGSRRSSQLTHLCQSLERRYGSHGLQKIGGREALEARLREEKTSPFALVQTLGREIEDALRKP